eukprot:jgi/Orpsp1_1/1183712/evm.model.c7180000086385.1
MKLQERLSLLKLILKELNNHLEDYCDGKCDPIETLVKYLVPNFIKVNSKFQHVADTKKLPNDYNEIIQKNGRFEPMINGNNLIPRIIYKEVSRKNGDTTPIKIDEKIMIGNINNKKGDIYQLGLQICNKNTKNVGQVKECFKKNVIENYINHPNGSRMYRIQEIQEIQEAITVEKLNEKSGKYNEFITLRNCGKLDSSRPFVDVSLQTNTTKEENGFWVYFIIIVEVNENDGSLNKAIFSDVHGLISHKQMTKRGDKSYIKNQLRLLETGNENLIEYYCKSMFQYNVQRDEYDFRNVFSFGIKFYEENSKIIQELVDEYKLSSLSIYDNLNNEELKTICELPLPLALPSALPSPTLTDVTINESINESPIATDESIISGGSIINDNLNLLPLSSSLLLPTEEVPLSPLSPVSSFLPTFPFEPLMENDFYKGMNFELFPNELFSNEYFSCIPGSIPTSLISPIETPVETP